MQIHSQLHHTAFHAASHKQHTNPKSRLAPIYIAKANPPNQTHT
jgi:hypothetical protein